jgi:2-hydroxy-3-oxopropionate reductase
VVDVIRGGLVGSRVLADKSNNMIREEFIPGFKVELRLKDFNNSINQAIEVLADTPITDITSDMLQDLVDRGYGSNDHSAFLLLYKK